MQLVRARFPNPQAVSLLTPENRAPLCLHLACPAFCVFQRHSLSLLVQNEKLVHTVTFVQHLH
jgi:hypothetical protein